MLHIPVLRWGEPYKSLDTDKVHHFATGEPIAEVSQANAGLIQRDMRKLQRSRDALREIPCRDRIEMCGKAADLFLNGSLPMGDDAQGPEDFVRCQSATTGLPENLVRLNMGKLSHVLTNLESILTALMRGLPFEILTAGHGMENDIPVSHQASTPALSIVLPSNSPGVHGLWLPVIPLQIGLVLKPGPMEPWTPYRMAAAYFEAGIPKEAMALYPGAADAGAAVISHAQRSLLFGSAATAEAYKGNPSVRVHGPGFSKILLGDDVVDDWEKYLDLMVTSVAINSGRGCINCSGIWASRHTREIAEAIAERLALIAPLPPDDPKAELAAFTIEGQAAAINGDIEANLTAGSVEDVTAKHRDTDRLVEKEHCAYLRPTVVHCSSADAPMAMKEYMFPFVTVVECPQEQMISKIGPTLVGSAITANDAWCNELLDAGNIDRLNVGPIPTTQLNWLQPHEGNIVEFLFRARAYQSAPLDAVAAPA